MDNNDAEILKAIQKQVQQWKTDVKSLVTRLRETYGQECPTVAGTTEEGCERCPARIPAGFKGGDRCLLTFIEEAQGVIGEARHG